MQSIYPLHPVKPAFWYSNNTSHRSSNTGFLFRNKYPNLLSTAIINLSTYTSSLSGLMCDMSSTCSDDGWYITHMHFEACFCCPEDSSSFNTFSWGFHWILKICEDHSRFNSGVLSCSPQIFFKPVASFVQEILWCQRHLAKVSPPLSCPLYITVETAAFKRPTTWFSSSNTSTMYNSLSDDNEEDVLSAVRAEKGMTEWALAIAQKYQDSCTAHYLHLSKNPITSTHVCLKISLLFCW